MHHLNEVEHTLGIESERSTLMLCCEVTLQILWHFSKNGLENNIHSTWHIKIFEYLQHRKHDDKKWTDITL